MAQLWKLLILARMRESRHCAFLSLLFHIDLMLLDTSSKLTSFSFLDLDLADLSYLGDGRTFSAGREKLLDGR